MRHRKRGRRLGRTSSHRRALLRNLTSALFLTERDDDFYDGLFQPDGKTKVEPPKHKGRIVTTLHKAKEVRPLVEKCITIAKKSIEHEEKASQLEPNAERGTDDWKAWRKSEKWQEWNAAITPAVNARRRVLQLIGDKEAVSILFEDIAPRFVDRPGGYTRVLRLADPRLGDAGTQAMLELVGVNDRKTSKSQKPAFSDDEGGAVEDNAPVAQETESEPEADEPEINIDKP